MESMICEVLATYAQFGGDLHDDTLLEKFENFLQSQWKTSGDPVNPKDLSNLENGIRDFLTVVISADVVQPEKLVLALRLGSGLILHLNKNLSKGHEKTDEAVDHLISLMNKCIKKEHWCDPSVRNAWLLSVSTSVTSEQVLCRIVANSSKYCTSPVSMNY